MNSKKLYWFWCLSVIAAVVLISLILNPSLVSILYSQTFYIISAYIVIDSLALIAGYSMLRKFSTLAFWRFLLYIAVIVAVSFSINFSLFDLARKSLLIFGITVYLIIAFLNFILSKILLRVNIRESFLIGILVGLVHALICIMATPVCNL